MLFFEGILLLDPLVDGSERLVVPHGRVDRKTIETANPFIQFE